MSEETFEKTTRTPPPERRFMIHNTMRRVQTKLKRTKAAGKDRMNLLLAGGNVRIPRGRYAIVTETALRRMHAELLKLEERGAVKVTDAVRRLVDLTTLEVISSLPVSPPTPQLLADPGAGNIPDFKVGGDLPTAGLEGSPPPGASPKPALFQDEEASEDDEFEEESPPDEGMSEEDKVIMAELEKEAVDSEALKEEPPPETRETKKDKKKGR
jgi:hypothetical protein